MHVLRAPLLVVAVCLYIRYSGVAMLVDVMFLLDVSCCGNLYNNAHVYIGVRALCSFHMLFHISLTLGCSIRCHGVLSIDCMLFTHVCVLQMAFVFRICNVSVQRYALNSESIVLHRMSPHVGMIFHSEVTLMLARRRCVTSNCNCA
jgi:hypothetical protein